MSKKLWLAAGAGALLLGGTALVLRLLVPGAMTILGRGAEHQLEDQGTLPPSPTYAPRVLVLALDGVDRELLYPLLKDGSLPEMAKLLGGQNGQFPHAHFDTQVLSTMPSSTLAAWATIFTGTPPAEHGVAGNEYFVRKDKRMAAPAPVSILDPEPVSLTYSDGYANNLLQVPTIYEQMRSRDPSANAWVAMSQFHRGAEKLLFASPPVLLKAAKGFLEGLADESDMQKTGYAALDNEVIESVVKALETEPQAPRVLTVYLTGTDYVAHSNEGGPDENRIRFLKEVTDPSLGRLREALAKHDQGQPRWTVVVSDHGHTEVQHDEQHALSTHDEDNPPSVVRGAGFRLRPFKLRTEDSDDFQAVMAYGGALAYVYVADRSGCAEPGQVCDFAKPARFEQDVVPMAQAFFEASRDGKYAPSMQGALDMVLVRTPQSEPGALPFEVYLGDGKSEPLALHLQKHPRGQYVQFPERLRELTSGPFGDHAGDVILLAHNGNETAVDKRYYFANLYRSWHGSPSKSDSEITCIVAHPSEPAARIRQRVAQVFGGRSQQLDVGKLIVELVTPKHDFPSAP